MQIACLLLAALGWADSVAKVAPDTVVVCPPEFREALEPWIRHRTGQGRRLEFVSNLQSSVSIRDAIRKVAKSGQLRTVVLIGDADAPAVLDPRLRRRSTPTRLVEAKVNIKWGSEPMIATDNWFADLDDDGAPDLAIGRLPADTPAELSTMVRKTIDYEQRAAGVWARRVNFVAGVGGFGRLIDPVIESTTKKFLTEGIPAGYNTSMTYGSWRSAFCPDPREFHRFAMDRHNEGCLFWVYIGHGQRTFLDRVQTPGGRFPIMDTRDIRKLNCQSGAPIAVFLACYTSAFDSKRDCLAEEMLRAEKGPVAILGGSRVTMPYAMAVLGTSMMDEYFQSRRHTLGDIVLHAKLKMVAPVPEDIEKQDRRRATLDALAKAISPAPDMLEEERAEHLALFNLLGDPLLQLPQPGEVSIKTSEEVIAGNSLNFRFASKVAGKARLEFVCRRDRTKDKLPARRRFDVADLASYTETYQKANDQVWLRSDVDVEAGESESSFGIPERARGHCFVRVFVQGKKEIAIGAAKVYVRPKPEQVENAKADSERRTR